MSSLPVGIKNLGVTDHLNSLIQVLFHLPPFRNLIYNVTTPPDAKPNECILLALQRLFYQLERKETGIYPRELMEAFGWDRAQAPIRHDIHEMFRKLMDELESQISKNNPHASSDLKKLLCGKIIATTRCTDGAPHVSRTVSDFYELDLSVKPARSLSESLEFFVAPEEFDLKLSFEADDDTEHDAERGSSILHAPPILMVHPNRLDFDMATLQPVAFPGHWSFPNEINLSRFVDTQGGGCCGGDQTTAKADVDNYEYVLTSVVMHTGGHSYGHHFAVCRQEGGDVHQWIKLNDVGVSVLSQTEFEADAFCGTKTHTDQQGKQTEFPSSTRAVLLVYVKKHLFQMTMGGSEQNNNTPIPRFVASLNPAPAGDDGVSSCDVMQIVDGKVHSVDTVTTIDAFHEGFPRFQMEQGVLFQLDAHRMILSVLKEESYRSREGQLIMAAGHQLLLCPKGTTVEAAAAALHAHHDDGSSGMEAETGKGRADYNTAAAYQQEGEEGQQQQTDSILCDPQLRDPLSVALSFMPTPSHFRACCHFTLGCYNHAVFLEGDLPGPYVTRLTTEATVSAPAPIPVTLPRHARVRPIWAEDLQQSVSLYWGQVPSLRTIRSRTLHVCSGLREVHLTGLRHLTHIGDFFLNDCLMLTKTSLVDLPELTSIGQGWLSGCIQLQALELSDLPKLSTIGTSWLQGCWKLSTLRLCNLPALLSTTLATHSTDSTGERSSLTTLDVSINLEAMLLCREGSTISVNLASGEQEVRQVKLWEYVLKMRIL